MRVIYEPKGMAREYADLACNDYIGCPHSCKYCFAPNVMRSDRTAYHITIKPRTDVIRKFFEDDCKHLRDTGDTRRVHMNFVSDPYPEMEKELYLTRYCIETAAKYGIGINILTKGFYDTVSSDFNLMKEAGVHLGVTMSLSKDESQAEWEPKAAPLSERRQILIAAHGLGIYTWVSMEPVIYPDEAIDVVDSMFASVDLWKVGKLNYNEHAKAVDWLKFRNDVTRRLDMYGAKYIIKKDLLEAK